MYRYSDPDRAARGSRLKPRPAIAAARGRRVSVMEAAMPSPRIAVLCVAAALCAAFLAMPAGGQERMIVSNQIEVSQSEASLRLEFSDGEPLAITFSGGRASVNGESLGSYEPDGAADREWRGLLSRVLSLSNGPLAEELTRWQPDPGPSGGERNLLAAVSGYFAGALAGMVQANARAPDEGNSQGLLQAMARSEDKEAFVQALDGIDAESLTVLVGRDHVVRAGTQVEGGILLVDGELDVRGRVRGDVIVVDGTLTLASGRVDGDVRLVDSRLRGSAGGVAGDVADISERLRREELENAARIRAEVQRELVRAEQSSRRTNPFVSRVRRASKFTFDTVIAFIVVGLLAWLATGLAGGRVGVVVRAISHQPARSAVVGLAGGFAAAPAYLIGIAVLVATMLGIPLLIVWVPLFPLVVLAAALVGLVGVADHVGRWVLRRGYRWLNRGDPGQPSYVRLLGLGTMFIPWVVGTWLQVLPLTGWVGNVIGAAGTMGFLLAVATGFGAVILTRGGVRPTDWAVPHDDFGDDEDGGDRW